MAILLKDRDKFRSGKSSAPLMSLSIQDVDQLVYRHFVSELKLSLCERRSEVLIPVIWKSGLCRDHGWRRTNLSGTPNVKLYFPVPRHRLLLILHSHLSAVWVGANWCPFHMFIRESEVQYLVRSQFW